MKKLPNSFVGVIAGVIAAPAIILGIIYEWRGLEILYRMIFDQFGWEGDECEGLLPALTIVLQTLAAFFAGVIGWECGANNADTEC